MQTQIIDLLVGLARLDDRQAILGAFTGALAGWLDAARVSVALRDPENPGHAVVTAVNGATGRLDQGSLVALEGTAVGAAIVDGRLISWATAERTEPDAVAMAALGIRHVVTAPIFAGHECHGSVNVGLADRPPTADEPKLLGRLAELLASQLDRVESIENLRQEIDGREARAERLMMLHGLESRLSRVTTIADVLSVLASSVFDLVPAERLSYARRGPGPGEATVYAIRGAGNVSEGTVISLDEDAFLRTWADQTLVYNPDHSNSEQEMHAALVEMGVLSSLNLGVFVNGTPVGTLNVGCRAVDGLAADDQAMLATLASFMGSTLERIDAHERLVFQAHHDVLTGLIRRERFEEQVEDELARLRSTGETSALCFLDLDRFKLVNDTEGHQVGDRLLRSVADRFRQSLDPDDLVARVGGDEFVVLLRGRRPEEYPAACERLVRSVSDAAFLATQSVVTSSASLGWTYVGSRTPSVHEALSAADAACYVAKSRGGGRAVAASAGDAAQAEHRSAGQVLNLVREALDHDRFVLLAQPIHALSRSGPRGFEVLLRMRRDDGALTLPGRFIPTVERYGLIADLDRWVLRSTLEEVERAVVAEMLPDGATVFVNVSANSIVAEGFVEEVSSMLADAAVEPCRFCFELTESGTMRNVDAALNFIERMKSLGASVALDDFGVGFSSLGALQHLPVDVLKIDGSLVRDVDSNPIDAAMVASVRTLAEATGMVTIAEHIESAAVLDVITSLGIDGAQGYFLGHPAPIERLLGVGPRPDRATTVRPVIDPLEVL